MANYEGAARSNYIRWDPEKLEALEYLFDIYAAPMDPDLHAIISNSDSGTPDCWVDWDDENQVKALVTLGIIDSPEANDIEKLLGNPNGLDPDIYFLDVVHLAFAKRTGGHFVWMWSGFEGGRYINGGAIVMNSKGKILKEIYLDSIHKTPGVKSRAVY